MYAITGIIALVAILVNVVHELKGNDGAAGLTMVNFVALAALLMSAWRAIGERREYARQKDAALALVQENDAAMQRLIEQFPCPVVSISSDFTVRRVNAAVEAVTGFSADKTAGEKCYNLFGHGQVCDNCPVERALATGQVQQNLKRELTADGRVIFIDQTAIPVITGDGRIQHVLEIAYDATHKVMLEQENRDLFIQTVGAMASLVDRRDTATGRHSAAVRDIAVRVGERMGLPPETLEEISIAALLHDIGKIGVSESILNKPGRLSEEEYGVIRQHPETGYNTLAGIKPLAKIAEYILYHHERFDGAGYPAGKKGEEIPLVSRILCVADVFEAVTADRVYRPAMDIDLAIEVMYGGRGGMFDPAVLDAFFDDLKARGGAPAEALAKAEINRQKR